MPGLTRCFAGETFSIKISEAILEILTLMPTGISALVGLERVGEMGSGEIILIPAAAGGLGTLRYSWLNWQVTM